MPDLQQNLAEWNNPARWREHGDEWSVTWGGAEAQWFGTIYPRVHAFLPVDTILEIAPGYGRWTQYLKDLCSTLIAVDFSDNCIAACKSRFELEKHIQY